MFDNVCCLIRDYPCPIPIPRPDPRASPATAPPAATGESRGTGAFGPASNAQASLPGGRCGAPLASPFGIHAVHRLFISPAKRRANVRSARVAPRGVRRRVRRATMQKIALSRPVLDARRRVGGLPAAVSTRVTATHLSREMRGWARVQPGARRRPVAPAMAMSTSSFVSVRTGGTRCTTPSTQPGAFRHHNHPGRLHHQPICRIANPVAALPHCAPWATGFSGAANGTGVVH